MTIMTALLAVCCFVVEVLGACAPLFLPATLAAMAAVCFAWLVQETFHTIVEMVQATAATIVATYAAHREWFRAAAAVSFLSLLAATFCSSPKPVAVVIGTGSILWIVQQALRRGPLLLAICTFQDKVYMALDLLYIAGIWLCAVCFASAVVAQREHEQRSVAFHRGILVALATAIVHFKLDKWMHWCIQQGDTTSPALFVNLEATITWGMTPWCWAFEPVQAAAVELYQFYNAKLLAPLWHAQQSLQQSAYQALVYLDACIRPRAALAQEPAMDDNISQTQSDRPIEPAVAMDGSLSFQESDPAAAAVSDIDSPLVVAHGATTLDEPELQALEEYHTGEELPSLAKQSNAIVIGDATSYNAESLLLLAPASAPARMGTGNATIISTKSVSVVSDESLVAEEDSQLESALLNAASAGDENIESRAVEQSSDISGLQPMMWEAYSAVANEEAVDEAVVDANGIWTVENRPVDTDVVELVQTESPSDDDEAFRMPSVSLAAARDCIFDDQAVETLLAVCSVKHDESPLNNAQLQALVWGNGKEQHGSAIQDLVPLLESEHWNTTRASRQHLVVDPRVLWQPPTPLRRRPSFIPPCLPTPAERARVALEVATRGDLVRDVVATLPEFHRYEDDDCSKNQLSPFLYSGWVYDKDANRSIEVLCKVYRDGDPCTNVDQIREEIYYYTKANEKGVPSPRIFGDGLTETDIKMGSDTFHVIVAEFKTNSPVGVGSTLQFAWSLTHAVSELHRIGILHCDIKPANVLWVEAEQTVNLIDFGHSQELGDDLAYPATIWYQAPEISNGNPHSPESDVYSVGKTIEEVVRRVKSTVRYASLDSVMLNKVNDVAKMMSRSTALKRISFQEAKERLEFIYHWCEQQKTDIQQSDSDQSLADSDYTSGQECHLVVLPVESMLGKKRMRSTASTDTVNHSFSTDERTDSMEDTPLDKEGKSVDMEWRLETQPKAKLL